MDPLAELQSPVVRQLVAANTAFGLDLYQRQRETRGNLVFSPLSISLALAIAYAGSAGRTRSQLGAALRFDGPDDHLHPAFAALQRRLASINAGGSVELSIVQSLWLQLGYRIRPAFTQLAEAHYGAEILDADFAAQPDAARARINRWVAERTNHRIRELLPLGMIGVLTRLVIANAVCFRGAWRHPFDPDQTARDSFWIAPDTSVEVPFMAQAIETGYAESADWQLLRLPYAGGALSMILLLPRRHDDLSALEASLSGPDLATWIGSAQRRQVEILLPRFKVTSGFSLKETLISLGVADAFDQDKADFSRLSDPADPLHISAVAHQAFIEVNEEGTEAAAATGVVLAARSMPPPPAVFRADRPFLFLIRDELTGAVLFLGRLANPAGDD